MGHALSLQIQLGVASMARKGWGADETKVAFEQALVLADGIGETPLRFSILYGLNTGRYLRSETAEALRHGEALVRLAENSLETAPAVVANRSYGITLMLTGRFRDAQTYFDRAFTLFDPQTHKGLERQYGQDLGVGSHCFMAVNLAYLGETRRANEVAREGERYAMACAHAHSICYMHMTMVLRRLWGTSQDEAELQRQRGMVKSATPPSWSLCAPSAGVFEPLRAREAFSVDEMYARGQHSLQTRVAIGFAAS